MARPHPLIPSAPVRERGGEEGFTLLEVLVAAALFALVMLLAGEAVSLALKGGRATAERVAADRQVAAAHGLVRRLVAESWPVVVRGSDARTRQAFDGRRDRLRLVAMLPSASGQHSAFEIRLAGGVLAVVRAPVDPALPDPLAALAEGAVTVLAEGVARGGFSYWGSLRPGTPPAWHDAWTDPTRPPVLVRLRLSFPAGSPRRWPDLVVMPKVESPVTF